MSKCRSPCATPTCWFFTVLFQFICYGYCWECLGVISVHVWTRECVHVPLCVCVCLLVLVCAQHGTVLVRKLEDRSSRAGSPPPHGSLLFLQLYYVPQASRPVSFVGMLLSLSPIPQGECWVCRGNCRVWVFMWALGDSTQVRLPMEPSPWPPDSLLLKVATKSTAVHYYDSQFRKHCKYLWRRARPQGACAIKS